MVRESLASLIVSQQYTWNKIWKDFRVMEVVVVL